MFIIEISSCGSVTTCTLKGGRIRKNSRIGKALLDCTRSGDCEPAVRHVLDTFKPEIRTVRCTNGQFANVIASHEEKVAVCRSIYSEDTPGEWDDETRCDIYLIWEAAHNYAN